MRRLGHFKSDGGGCCDVYICRQILEESSCLILKRHSDRKYQGGVAAMFTTTVSRPLIGRGPRDLAADWLLSVVVNIAAMADLPATRPASIHGNQGCHGGGRGQVEANSVGNGGKVVAKYGNICLPGDPAWLPRRRPGWQRSQIPRAKPSFRSCWSLLIRNPHNPEK